MYWEVTFTWSRLVPNLVSVSLNSASVTATAVTTLPLPDLVQAVVVVLVVLLVPVRRVGQRLGQPVELGRALAQQPGHLVLELAVHPGDAGLVPGKRKVELGQVERTRGILRVPQLPGRPRPGTGVGAQRLDGDVDLILGGISHRSFLS